MTCIVGIRSDTQVVMGADSFEGTDLRRGLTNDKLWTNDLGWLCGVSGSLRLAQLLRYMWKPEKPGVTITSILEHLVCQEVGALWDICKEHGGLKRNKEGLEMLDGGILLAINGALFTIHSDSSVVQEHNYAAIGVGRPYALGALFATSSTTSTLRERVTMALEAAAAHATQVCSPFQIETQDVGR